MAVGGMIGGGIFSTLGVVVAAAGKWAWLSFAIGGLIALATGHSYVVLTTAIDKPGGSYQFLRELGYRRLARASAWVLTLGYILTVSVYGYTFAAYVTELFAGSAWTMRIVAAAVIVALAGVNLMGVGEASAVEVFAVWAKLAILLALAVAGFLAWDPHRLQPAHAPGLGGAIAGAGAVFMAYEGFQLLAYDYADLVDRNWLFPRVVPAAIVAACLVYVSVALGATMLVGADAVVAKGEVALAIAGEAALGSVGLVAMTLAAVFSAGSAINATLFATARLARTAALEGDMPRIFARVDKEGVPYAGLVLISAAAVLLSAIGGLGGLVTSASMVFLVLFAVVNALATRARHAAIAWAGLAGTIAAAAALCVHLLGWG